MDLPKYIQTQAAAAVKLVKYVDDEVVEHHHAADEILRTFFRKHKKYGSRDRRFFTDLVYSWFRWRGWIKEGEKNEWMRRCVIAGLMDAPEWGPALHAMIASLEKPIKDPEPMGSLSIAAKAQRIQAMFHMDKPPTIADAFPDWVGHHVREHSWLTGLQNHGAIWLRTRPDTHQKVIEALDKEKAEYTIHPLLPHAICTYNRSAVTLLSQKLSHLFDLQNLSSQCVGHVCDPQEGEHWWDCCAGSGGKSIHLAELRETGMVFATDRRLAVMDELSRRVKTYKGKKISMRMLDVLRDDPPEQLFDGVLIDAPCTGIGTWGRNADARWRMGEAQLQKMLFAQQNILEKASLQVKPGGVLVYSVCTLTHDETSDMVGYFLKNHPHFEMQGIRNPATGEKSEGPLWLLPNDMDGDAMYIARMVNTQTESADPA
jgi:16S rRNA (cytosine967-C5)-methyltransferase